MRHPAYLLTLFALTACGSTEGQAHSPGASSAQSLAAEDSSFSGSNQERLPPPGQAWVIFGTDTVQAEVARTAEEREMGLMYREELAKGSGMIFIFPDTQIRSFWMKNTFIPLDIAYLDAEIRIVDIQGMESESLDAHPSAAPAMFALEVPLGWFQEVGIRVGAQARLVFGPG